MWWLPLVPIGFLTDRSSRWRWLLMPGIVTFTALTSSAAKLVIRRPRPGSARHFSPWGRLGAAAFPSTHSACAFAIAGWLRGSRHGRRLHGVAVLIGYSRVRCQAHHPTDVAAGAILGYGIAWKVERAWSRLIAPHATRLVGDTGDKRSLLSSAPGPVNASLRNHFPRSRDHSGGPVGQELSLQSLRRDTGVGSAGERRSPKSAPAEAR